jgi:uncharacterized protein YfaS (alpha-2-macroglobulin family)
MVVAVTPRPAGKVMLNIIADRLITTISQDVQPGTNQIRVPVGRDWDNGGYAVATLLRPLDVAAQRLPGRATPPQIGINEQPPRADDAAQPPRPCRASGVR